MAIPGPGVAISINTIVAEFGGTAPHSLSEYYRGGGLVPNSPTNAAIPTSGQIALSNFYGAANRVSVPLTISANTQNYDVYTNASASPSYVAGASDVTVTINSGIVVGSASTGSYAMLVPSAFNSGDTVTIVNNGYIVGAGGAGGKGSNSVPSGVPGAPGGGGGNALYVNRATVVTNNGTIGAGGGGGGGGGAGQGSIGRNAGGGGGGGGAGNNVGSNGAAGTGAPTAYAGSAGSPGALTTGGSGGSGGPTYGGGPGGAGGGLGASGVNGTNGAGPVSSNPGGAGGANANYITGNSFVTWPTTGTRLGGVA